MAFTSEESIDSKLKKLNVLGNLVNFMNVSPKEKDDFKKKVNDLGKVIQNGGRLHAITKPRSYRKKKRRTSKLS